MTLRNSRRCRSLVFSLLLLCGLCGAHAGLAQVPQFELPPVPKSQHVGHNGPAVIVAKQPDFPAEIVLSTQSDTDWLNYAQVTSRVANEIITAKLGWAYVLPSGLEFHESELLTPKGGVTPRGSFQVEEQHVAPRTDAKALIAFVEEVTYTDGTVKDADHAQIKAFYTSCCSGAGGTTAAATAPAPAPKPRSPVAIEPVIRLAPRANAAGVGMIPVLQPNMPWEFLSVEQSSDDWLRGAQLHNRSTWGYVTYRMGWAYVLPSGLEFHSGEPIHLEQRVGPNGLIDVPDQHVAPRADAKEFLFFLEEATQGDESEWKTTHDKIEAEYKLCCSKRNVAGEYTPEATAVAAMKASMDTAVQPLGMDIPIKFDIVSFRRAEHPGSSKVDLPALGDYIAYHGVPMLQLLLFAYEHKGYFQITNQPAWVNSDLYEFQAKVAPEDIPAWRKLTLTQKRVMMRGLLAEQLKLTIHNDAVEHDVYNLVVAKGGPKLTEYQPGDTLKMPWGESRTGAVLTWVDPFHLVCQDQTMADLVNSISGPDRAGRVVIDKTGLSGSYNFSVPIPYKPLPDQLREMGEDAGVPTFFDGLKQLGLQLVPGKSALDGIVVDHIEKPPEN